MLLRDVQRIAPRERSNSLDGDARFKRGHVHMRTRPRPSSVGSPPLAATRPKG
jgi:hypothetical protein